MLQGKEGADHHQKWWGWPLGCRVLGLYRWLAEEFCTPFSIYGPYSFDLHDLATKQKIKKGKRKAAAYQLK